jgi:DNA-binding NarL/FixJ family response regulator
MRKLRVLLADDHPGLLAAVRSLLETDTDVIACVDDGECLFEAAMKLQPDIIVTDISMPKLSGIQVANRLRESGCPSRIVFLTVHTDPDVIRVALETGALGYVVKTSLTSDLLLAIREAFLGRTFVSLETSAEQWKRENNHPK